MKLGPNFEPLTYTFWYKQKGVYLCNWHFIIFAPLTFIDKIKIESSWKACQDCHKFWGWVLWQCLLLFRAEVSIYKRTYVCVSACELTCFSKYLETYVIDWNPALCQINTGSVLIDSMRISYLFQSPPNVGSLHQIKQQ